LRTFEKRGDFSLSDKVEKVSSKAAWKRAVDQHGGHWEGQRK
jgi:hypothetical protein